MHLQLISISPARYLPGHAVVMGRFRHSHRCHNDIGYITANFIRKNFLRALPHANAGLVITIAMRMAYFAANVAGLKRCSDQLAKHDDVTIIWQHGRDDGDAGNANQPLFELGVYPACCDSAMTRTALMKFLCKPLGRFQSRYATSNWRAPTRSVDISQKLPPGSAQNAISSA